VPPPAEEPPAPHPLALDEPVAPEEALRHIRKLMRDVIGKLEAGEEALRSVGKAS
jgi:hypothetical protein